MRAFLLLLLALIVLSPERALLAQPLKQMYQFTPLQAQGFASIEAVLTVSKEPAALSWAYDGKLNLHNKFGPDRGFNPAIEYVGLFDSRSCYNYVGAIGQKPRPRGAGADQTFYAVSDAQGYFKWLKPTIEDLSVVALAASRPKTLSVLTLTPRSKIGICNHPEEKTDPLSFSGNWLNYIASSRLDAFLAFLYGGRRLIDSDDRTVITHSLAPLAWGEEILADREFTQESSWHPWYDISKFTPFPRPEGGRSHLLVRGGDFSEDDGHWPALKVLLNVSLAFFNQKELKESRINLDFDKNQLLSLWLNLNIPSPDDSVLTPRALKEVMVYNLKAEVCASQAEALSASCLAYRGSSDKEGAKIFKPAGLIQRLSESQMGSRLGLAIKSFSKSIFLAPAPISGPQSLAGAVPAIDSLNGQIVKGGLIDSLEKAFDNERFGSVDPFLDKFKALSLRLERPASPIGEVVSQALKLLAPENLSSCTRPIIFVAGNFYFAPKSALNSDFSSFSVESWLSSLKDLNLVLGPQALSRSEEIYGLELGPSADYPPIFILRGRDGQIVHRLALWPKAIFNDSSESLGPIEWQIIDWEADKEGHPFKLEIEAIFALESGEALRVRYKIELLFSSAQDNVSSKRAKIDSGELKGARLYLFENERGANNLSYLRAIDLALVEGFLVTTSLLESNSNQLAAIGYEISGSNRDGPYFDLTLGAFSKQEFLTPEGRVLVGSDLSAHSRAHSLGPSSFLNTGQGLLALVAQSNLGRRLGQLPLGRKREYFSLLHLNDLYQRLSPLTRFSGGEAFFSSIPAPNFSYAGGALAIGSVWWPALGKSADGFWLDGESQASLGVGWAGTVYALWLDNSAKLIGLEGPKGLFSRFLTFLTPRPSYPAQGAFWDAGRWLAELDPQGDRLLSGSRKWEVAATRNQGQRLIWSTEPNSDSLLLFNGSEESIKSFEPHLLNIKSWESFSDIWQNNSERLAMTLRLVDWIVGAQRPNLRNRMFKSPWESNRNLIWRLGDTINSKPVLVGAPSCGYEAIYSSSSYADFKVQYSKRRRMVYFGANDGMLHAVNAGFLKDPSLGPLGFDKEGPNNETPHELGAEMWAYIPASVLPKLQWLAEPGYQHSFYIDLKPLITDVKINGQWRTVLIGGLGLGGRLIESPSGGEPVFSEIFCLDITDPEKPPKFMWRYQSFALGLTVGLPAAVVSGGRWRIIVPSGPITDRVDKDGQLIYGLNSPYEGLSERPARVIVLDAETGKRVDKEGQLTVPATEGHSFFGSAVVPMAHGVVGGAEEWNNHVVYFGLSQSFDPVTGLEGGGVYRLRMVDPTTFEPLSPDKWALERFVSLKRPISGAVNLTRDGLGNIWVLFGAGRLFSQRDLNPCLNSESVQCQENHENYFYGLKEPRDPQSGLITFEDLSEKLEEVIDVSDITVLSDGSLKNAERSSYGELSRELLEKNSLGWRRKLNLARFIDSKGAGREIFYGQPRLTAFGRGGSLLIFSSFEPRVNPQSCTSLGLSYLYVLDAFTGLPNPDLNLNALNFAPLSLEGSYKELSGEVAYELLAGLAKPISYDLAPSPSLVKSASGLVILYLSAAGLTALNVTSEFIPVNSIISWREVVDMGFKISDNVMSLGVDTAND